MVVNFVLKLCLTRTLVRYTANFSAKMGCRNSILISPDTNKFVTTLGFGLVYTLCLCTLLFESPVWNADNTVRMLSLLF